MKISLLYATARPSAIIDLLYKWSATASGVQDIEVIIVTDKPILAEHIYPYDYSISYYINQGRRDCVTAYNLAASKATGNFLIQVADDFYPLTTGWDEALASLVNTDEVQAVAVADNSINTDGFAVMRHAFITRKFYEWMGYLFYPEYESMYSDDDFSAMAHLYADVIDGRSKLRFEHAHVGPQRDAIAARHESVERYRNGQCLFALRQATGFKRGERSYESRGF